MKVREIKLSYAPTPAVIDGRTPVRAPDAAAAIIRPILNDEIVEVAGALLLDTRHRVIGWHQVSRGGLDGTIIHARDLFRAAILAAASGVIVAHNHPSGDASPSADDVALTARLRAAGETIGIDVLDHVIIGSGSGRYYSFKEAGQL